MSENYRGDERRKDQVDIQNYMGLLVSNVKELFTSEMTTVKIQIKSLEDKLVTKLESHEIQSAEKLLSFENELICIKGKIIDIEKRVDDLELKPVKAKAGAIDDLSSVFKKLFYAAIAAGLVGFLSYLFIGYIKGL